MNPTVELAKALIQRRSVTPQDAGCQHLITERLAAKGFRAESLDQGDVCNLWLRRGEQAPLFVFAGHTDVVPAGDEAQWRHPPFAASEDNGLLYGRGAADMKGGIAAFVTACEQFVEAHPKHAGSIAILLTSNEEGITQNGSAYAIKCLRQRGEVIRWCVVAEPSSEKQLGDTIKHGRRGSLSAHLTVIGKQGHVAYPQFAANPVHLAAPLLAQLTSQRWDQGNADFPPTSLQVSNMHAGTGADNVIPGQLEIEFNIRFSNETSAPQLQQAVEAMLADAALDYRIEWRLSGEPFLTVQGELTQAVCAAVHEMLNIQPKLSTAGGTSDSRFIAHPDTQVIELGLVNETIHAVDEHVRVADLQQLSNIYVAVLQKLLLS